MLKAIGSFISTSILFLIVGLFAAVYVFGQYGRDLPDYRQLAVYEPPITTRFYAGNGQILAEFAREKRVFVPVDAMPDKLKYAFMAAEDKNFLIHNGIDYSGIARAVLSNVKNVATGKRMVGASTITQQVAKNFLLTNEVSFRRKIKEAILAYRIEKAYTKEHILELYLNEIYLGFRSYGVGAAALNYFGKSLSELKISEMAFLAALPKGPNNYNPYTRKNYAIGRRDWVLDRMVEEGYITELEATEAKKDDIDVVDQKEEFVKAGEYFTEAVRREIIEKYGEKDLYENGMLVRTTVDPELQVYANHALRKGLEDIAMRSEWKGVVARIEVGDDWATNLADVKTPIGANSKWQKAVVLDINDKKATVSLGLQEEIKVTMSFADMSWARKANDNGRLISSKKPSDILAIGDVIMVENISAVAGKPIYALRQEPKVEGALVAMDPHTGRVLALSGGYSFERSEFNRAIQAKRQPGSAFKPFVYLAALDNGYTPADLILDAPIVLDQGPGQGKWKPENYSSKFYGPTTLRVGVEHSRNLMTIRLAQAMGMDKVVEYSDKFGISSNLPPVLSMALGAGETTVLNMAAAYGELVNGGKKIAPTMVDRIQDRQGKTVYKSDNRTCEKCSGSDIFWVNQEVPQIPDNREQLTNPLSAYQMVSILHGVVERGTGYKLKQIKKTLAGKTGTTNNNYDAWFVGFSPDLVVAVFVGYDNPRPIGRDETGSKAAAPIFVDFMQNALKNTPDTPFRIPSGIKLVRVNYENGRPAKPNETKGVILEAFKPDTDVNVIKDVIGGFGANIEEDASSSVKLGVEY